MQTPGPHPTSRWGSAAHGGEAGLAASHKGTCLLPEESEARPRASDWEFRGNLAAGITYCSFLIKTLGGR